MKRFGPRPQSQATISTSGPGVRCTPSEEKRNRFGDPCSPLSLCKSQKTPRTRMHQQVEIAITGSGSFATEVLHALARETEDIIDIALLGRDADRLASLARSATEQAARRLRVVTIVVDWSDLGFLTRTIGELRPKVLVHTASLQSPWTIDGSDQWSKMIKTVGFGVTVPLQAVLALRVARAIADASPTTSLVNACYPDAVNSVLRA